MTQCPLVSISCLTYNHAPYLRQCLDGFVMQITSFPIEILIYDDASGDGTQNIIEEYQKKYPDIIKPIYQTENQYSKGVKVGFVYNYSRAKGEYIAFPIIYFNVLILILSIFNREIFWVSLFLCPFSSESKNFVKES